MYLVFRDEVFPFIKNLHQDEQSAYSRFMKDAVFIMPTPSLLERAVTMIADIPMEDRDTKGDLYEYLLSKIAQAGVNGQFRTPRHIIKLMVELMAPQPKDVIGDPACGTCGFLIAAGKFLREHHKKLFVNKSQREHFQTQMFHGSDFDASMLRIAFVVQPKTVGGHVAEPDVIRAAGVRLREQQDRRRDSGIRLEHARRHRDHAVQLVTIHQRLPNLLMCGRRAEQDSVRHDARTPPARLELRQEQREEQQLGLLGLCHLQQVFGDRRVIQRAFERRIGQDQRELVTPFEI